MMFLLLRLIPTFNPLIDLPFYYMIKYLNDFPGLVSAIQGLYFGVVIFIVYKFAELFFSENYKYKNCLTIFATIIGTTGFATFMQISTTSNEMQISIFVLWALYLLYKNLFFTKTEKSVSFLCSGMLLGMAAGFKLTAVMYCISVFLLLLFYRKKLQISYRSLFIFCLAGGLSFLLINGFWMWHLWKLYANPLFPFANTIFRSEYFDNFDYSDRRYLPKNLIEYLFYPFIWAVHYSGRVVAELNFIDLRFALIYLILLFYVVREFIYKKKEERQVKFLFVYIAFSYILWLSLFSIIRYSIPIEVFSGIIIVKFFYDIFPKKEIVQLFFAPVLVTLFFILVSIFIHSNEWGSRKGDQKIIDVEKIVVEENDVILQYNLPVAGIIPTMIEGNSKVRVIGIKQGHDTVMEGSDFTERGPWKEIKEKILRERKGKIVAFVRKSYNALYDIDMKKEKYLEDLSCRKLINNLDEHLYVCQ